MLVSVGSVMLVICLLDGSAHRKIMKVTAHELWCWRIGPNARAAPGDALPQPGALPLLPTGLSNP